MSIGISPWCSLASRFRRITRSVSARRQAEKFDRPASAASAAEGTGKGLGTGAEDAADFSPTERSNCSFADREEANDEERSLLDQPPSEREDLAEPDEEDEPEREDDESLREN
ncbi:unnamed protein product, partial [Ectocarpus sp. 12 AP-2014]